MGCIGLTAIVSSCTKKPDPSESSPNNIDVSIHDAVKTPYVKTREAIKVIEEKYGNNPNFKFYASPGKRILPSDKHQTTVSLYGIIAENEINDCVSIIKAHSEGLPDSYRVNLTFYEEEVLIKRGSLTTRGEEREIATISI